MQRIDINNITEVTFMDLLKICESNFGHPLVMGDHYIFEMPWSNDPIISLQKDGIIAKPYQVKIVKEALDRLEVNNDRH